MSTIPEIKEMDPALSTEPVRQARDSRTAEIQQSECHSIRYINTEESNLGLDRGLRLALGHRGVVVAPVAG